MKSGQKSVATNEPGNRVPRKRERPSEKHRFLINAQRPKTFISNVSHNIKDKSRVMNIQ